MRRVRVRPGFRLAVGVALAAAAVGCGSASGGAGPASTGPDRSAAADTQVTLSTRPSAAGSILTDATGRAVYIFLRDDPRHARCGHDCRYYWPPLVAARMPVAGPGVDAGQIGLGPSVEGGRIVTYAGHPLYHYSEDSDRSTHGQDLNQFGAPWRILAPGGAELLQPTPDSYAAPGDAAPAALHVAHSPLGTYLTDAQGMAVYVFSRDGRTSRCGASCMRYWPPVAPMPGGAGATTTPAGARIAIIAGHPLYEFAFDQAPGQRNGAGVRQFGGVWHLVTRSGRPLAVR
jgi:predicted lipoprotein with Yx(FWY)xxD motif